VTVVVRVVGIWEFVKNVGMIPVRIVWIRVTDAIGLDVFIVLKYTIVRVVPSHIVRIVIMARNTVSSTVKNVEATIALLANLMD